MLPDTGNPRFLIRYLLGELDEDEQVLVEDRAFSNSEYLQEIEAAETDLIDSYVRGELSVSEGEAFEERFLTSPKRRSKVEFSQTFARIAAESQRRLPRGWRDLLAQAPTVFRPDTLFHLDELAWKPTPFDGIDVKILSVDASTGSTTTLLRMRPGSRYPAHRHAADEHTFVLAGDVDFHDHSLSAGDYEVASGESYHPVVTTRGGCMVLLKFNTADQVLA